MAQKIEPGLSLDDSRRLEEYVAKPGIGRVRAGGEKPVKSIR
jgi:hypothetical protein